MRIRLCQAILVFFTMVGSTSHATTFAIFSQDGQTATIMVNGRPGDPDATQLFQILAAPIEELQGKITKRVSFADDDGIKCFSIVCVMSKIIPDNGSCTVVMHPASGLIIDREAKAARYALAGAIAERFKNLFTVHSGAAYLSRDGKLKFDFGGSDGLHSSLVEYH